MRSDLSIALEVIRDKLTPNIVRHPVAMSAERIAEGRSEIRIQKALTDHEWNVLLWALDYVEGKAV